MLFELLARLQPVPRVYVNKRVQELSAQQREYAHEFCVLLRLIEVDGVAAPAVTLKCCYDLLHPFQLFEVILREAPRWQAIRRLALMPFLLLHWCGAANGAPHIEMKA